MSRVTRRSGWWRTTGCLCLLVVFVLFKVESPLAATLKIAGESGVGAGAQFLDARLQEWMDETGHRVESISMPNSSTERLALYQQYWAAGADDIDLFLIDVIWPGLAAPYLMDLGPQLDEEQLAAFLPALLRANRVGDRLVALPLWSDVGLLYVRSDLLQKYGFDRAPQTWEELTSWAERIQAGERESDRAFQGFVWQGARYEGLTCNAQEWLVSSGAGPLLQSDGTWGLDVERAAQVLRRAAGWVGTVSPTGVTTYMEEEARQIWQGGHAAFLRSWPYVYALSRAQASPVRERFEVVELPAGPGGERAATLGGWQLAISQKTRHPQVALHLLSFLTSERVQRLRALELGQPPTLRSLYLDPEVVAANPHFEIIEKAMQHVAIRPANLLADRYQEFSNAFYTAVHDVLVGSQEPHVALRRLRSRIQRLQGRR